MPSLKFVLVTLVVFINTINLFAVDYPLIVWSYPAATKKIALTFDDGPKPEYSRQILDILDKYDVKATFFVVGREAKSYPDVILRMHKAGHDIASHTYSHYRLDTLTEKQLDLELSATNQILKEITGQDVLFFRPPGGRFNQLILDELKKYNLHAIMWNINAGDYQPGTVASDDDTQTAIVSNNRSSKNIFNTVTRQAKNGSIILFHNGAPQTIKILPDVIASLRKQGYKLVTITELLNTKK
jgi:peptidoglycan/xylan/chitin deacetylase (PgdA/CDA1 family)